MKWVMQGANGNLPSLAGSCNLAPVAGYESRTAEMDWRLASRGVKAAFDGLSGSHTDAAVELTILNATEVVFAMKDAEGVVTGIGTPDVPLAGADVEVDWLPGTKGERTGAFLNHENFPVTSRALSNFAQNGFLLTNRTNSPTEPMYSDQESSAKLRLNAEFIVMDKDFSPDPTKSYSATIVVTCAV